MFRLLNVANRAVLEVEGRWYDIETVSGNPDLSEPMAAVARWAELHELADVARKQSTGFEVWDSNVGPCVPRPSKVFAVGLNYRDHAEESSLAIPSSPMVFTKFPSSLAGPGDTIEPSGDHVDWEVEVVAVIGTRGRDISERDAWSHVAGLTLGQDISDRAIQMKDDPPQFSLGKSFDGYGPIGPAVVSVDTFEDPDRIRLWCDRNGKRVQESDTGQLVFSIPELVARLSAVCTLEPGDLIFTGTPAGVGQAAGTFLRPGDNLLSGAEEIGEFTNTCRSRPDGDSTTTTGG